MPYKIVKKGDKWAVETVDGKVLGTHDTKSDAKAQQAAVYANTPKSHLEENETWKKIKHFVYNHPVYGELTEEEKASAVNSIFDKHQNDNMELLSEYVDMFMLPTAGWGPNSGSRLAYNIAGRGSSGGGGSIPGYGGIGTGMLGGKSRQGTRVYGAVPNNIANSEGVVQLGGKNGDPAIVMVAPKQSNYKPWTTQMTADGEYRQKDIDRNKYEAQKEDMWEGPMGELARALEDNGYDIDDLNSMSEEELEDIIIRVAKKEHQAAKAEQDQQAINESIENGPVISQGFITTNDLLEATNRVLRKLGYTPEEMTEEEKQSISSHAINFFNEYDNKMSDLEVPEKYSNLLEKWKRYSKIQIAREVLAAKHQQKKALEKEPGGKAYIIDRYGIEKMMYKFGYTYDDSSKKWIKVSKKKDTDGAGGSGGQAASDQDQTPPIPPIDTKRSTDDTSIKPSDQNQNIETDPTKPSTKAGQPTDDGSYITIPLSQPQDAQKIKDFQARFILVMAHNVSDANKFNYDEEKDAWIPVIPEENIAEQMNNLLYDWISDKNVWLTEAMTLPDQLYSKNENKSSVVGRSYLAALGNLDYIKTDETGTPIIGPEQVSSAMEASGFQYDDDVGKWEYVKQPEAQLNESRKLTEERKLDLSDVGVLNGRMVLKAHQLMKSKLEEQNQETVIAGAEKPELKKDEQDSRKDPLASNSYPSTIKMNMDDTVVEEQLIENGYKLFKIGRNPYWSDKEGQVPQAVKSITGDDLKTFIGRSIVAALNPKNGLEYLSFAGDPQKKEKIRAKKPSSQIEEKLNAQNIEWDESKGWGYGGTSDKKQDAEDEKDIVDPDLKAYYTKIRTIQDKYRNADWDMMSDKQRKAYQSAVEISSAIKFNPDLREKWPTGDDLRSQQIRNKHIARMKHYYKFDPATKSMVKRQKPASIAGGHVNLKVAAQNAFKRLKNLSFTAGTGILGALGQLAKTGLDAAYQSTGMGPSHRKGEFPDFGLGKSVQAAKDHKATLDKMNQPEKP